MHTELTYLIFILDQSVSCVRCNGTPEHINLENKISARLFSGGAGVPCSLVLAPARPQKQPLAAPGAARRCPKLRGQGEHIGTRGCGC